MSRITFVDKHGNPLPIHDQESHPLLRFMDSDPRRAVTKQYAGRWYVQVPKGINPAVRVETGENDAGEFKPLIQKKEPSTYELPQSLSIPAAGVLRFVDRQGTDSLVALSPSLYVQPASLKEEEYTNLLRRLGNLCVAVGSATLAPIPDTVVGGPVTDGEGEPDDPRFRPISLYLRLARVMQRQWPLIQNTPARRVAYRIQHINTRRASNSAQVAQKRAKHPGRRRLSILGRQEVTDTQENEVLAFVLQRVLIDQGPVLIQQLKSIKDNDLRWSAPLYDLVEKKKKDVRAQRTELVKSVQSKIHEVQKTIKWAKRQARAPIIASCGEQPELPSSPSRQLMRSAEYGPVYRALIEYLNHQPTTLDPRDQGLLYSIRERGILPTRDLYEKWVFMELYGQLILSFGFEPESSADNLFAVVSAQNGLLKLDSGTTFSLVRRVAENSGRKSHSKIRIELSYEPRVDRSNRDGYLKPDVYARVKRDRRSALEFAFDAKYRSYASMSGSGYASKEISKYGESHYFWDLLGTARDKYLHQLGTIGAFIIHSDPEKDSYWGGFPIGELEGSKQQTDTDKFVSHRFGSIFSTPDGPGQGLRRLEKLWRCILAYHCKLDDICWTCGSRVQPTRVTQAGKESRYGKGRLYQCCDRFWIVTNCTNSGKHKLVKYGRESFHAIKDDDPWSCTCPTCGDLHGQTDENPNPSPPTCKKCGGSGHIPSYSHVAGGVCFRCGGSGDRRTKKQKTANTPNQPDETFAPDDELPF